MRYHLSNAQSKELLIRKSRLAIAIPAPPEDPPDWLAWARGVLVDVGELIVQASPRTVNVAPDTGGGLTGLIGKIRPEYDASELCWGVDAVVCHLDPPNPRHKRGALQWPGQAVRGEQKWP